MIEPDPALDAVRWALAAYLDPQQAQQAAEMWQRPPAAEASSMLVGLSRYCRRVAQQFNLQGREAELHLRIIRAFQSQAKAGRVPASMQADQGVAPLQASPSALMVQHLLQALEQHVAREADASTGYTAQRWRQSLVRHSQKLPAVPLKQATDWLWGHTSALLGEWPARGLGTGLINAAYVAAAEWLGPVKADACLTLIVRECELGGNPAFKDVRSYL